MRITESGKTTNFNKAVVMAGLADIGKDIAAKARQEHWPAEDNDRAIPYRTMLTEMRVHYSNLRRLENRVNILCALENMRDLLNGIERNFLERIIDYVKDGTVHYCIRRHMDIQAGPPKFAIGDRVINPGPSHRSTPLYGTVRHVSWNESFREYAYDLELTGGASSTAWEHELRKEG